MRFLTMLLATEAALALRPRPINNAMAASRRALLSGAAAAALMRPSLSAAAEEEPEAATRLLSLVEGKRPADWKRASPATRAEIDGLIEELAQKPTPWTREQLRGKWKLAYLQPGPDGAGVDRRIPFPEFDFNDSFQIFGTDSVINVGEVLGPALEVRVSGSLSEADPSDLIAPKRFKANIDQGALCASITMGSSEKANIGRACLPLPIQGEGIFDGVYLGKRLRIGQNLNGGGVRAKWDLKYSYSPRICSPLCRLTTTASNLARMQARIVQVRVTNFSGR
jgi:hypothetical protein